MERLMAAAVAVLLVAVTAAAAGPNSAIPVLRVDSASAAPAPGAPRKLVIEAEGAVRSGGWAHPQLWVKLSAEKDILYLEFVARPPSPRAAVVQATVPVKAMVTVPMPGPSIKEIRIAGETNTVVAKILR